jgi:ribonuclease HI
MIDDVKTPRVGYIPVYWKAPCDRFLKVNTDDSLIGSNLACGAIFRDKHGTYFGSFSCKINCQSVLHAELMAIILAIEQALERGWLHLWVESDSQVVIQASKNFSIVPWDLRNRWSNCFSHNMQLLFSHVFREGNCCADKLANHGHNIMGFHWWDSMPPFLQEDFYRDRYGVPNFRRT